jgi:hypothetical protein
MAYSPKRDNNKDSRSETRRGLRLMGSEGYRAPGFCVTLAMIISTISSIMR